MEDPLGTCLVDDHSFNRWLCCFTFLASDDDGDLAMAAVFAEDGDIMRIQWGYAQLNLVGGFTCIWTFTYTYMIYVYILYIYTHAHM